MVASACPQRLEHPRISATAARRPRTGRPRSRLGRRHRSPQAGRGPGVGGSAERGFALSDLVFWFPWDELYLAIGKWARRQVGGFAASGLAFGFPRANFYSARAKLTEHRVGDFAVGLKLLFARDRIAFGVVDRPRVPEQIAEIEKSDSGENETERPQGQPDPRGIPPDTASQGTKSRLSCLRQLFRRNALTH
jgi:hypothetical protein